MVIELCGMFMGCMNLGTAITSSSRDRVQSVGLCGCDVPHIFWSVV